jgi:hypothetical protein
MSQLVSHLSSAVSGLARPAVVFGALVFSGNASATSLGILTPPDSIGFTGTVSGSFVNTFQFTLGSDADMIATAINQYFLIGSGQITQFAGTLTDPSNVVTPLDWELGSVNLISMKQTLSYEGIGMLPGNYLLTISGIAPASPQKASFSGTITVIPSSGGGGNPDPIPEPSTLALLAISVAGMGFTARRRNGAATKAV